MFCYCDNQGYYFFELMYDEVDVFLFGIGECVDMVCLDVVVDECIWYYVVINNVFGFVNVFGMVGLVDE